MGPLLEKRHKIRTSYHRDVHAMTVCLYVGALPDPRRDVAETVVDVAAGLPVSTDGGLIAELMIGMLIIATAFGL